jgi:hypothetical protein
MPDDKNNLYLYEAIELRAEYDARLKELRTLLPEARENRDRFYVRGDDDSKRRPAPGFSLPAVREELNALAARKRTLNNAIQRANFDSRVAVAGETMSLSEALELRKAVNEQIGELSTQLAKAAYERVVYKEERDIVEAPEISCAEVRKELDEKRRLFRTLNRNLRAAAHDIVVEFRDEP